MITCRQAAELVCRTREVPLGWRGRLALAFHLCLCAMCRRFLRQSELLDTAGRLAGADAPPPQAPAAALPTDARERIKEALRRADAGGANP